eukprot:gene29211-6174_t
MSPGGDQRPLNYSNPERMDVLLSKSYTRQSSGTLSNTQSRQTLSECVSMDDDDSCSSDSSPSSSSPSRRSIAVAKQILSEATLSFTPKLSISAAKHDMCRNTGAMGPLLEMLRVSNDAEKVSLCLDTVSFLTMDKANRKTLASLDGVGAILQVVQRLEDPTIQTSALQALKGLVRHEDADKVGLWSHPNKEAALDLLSPKHTSQHLLACLACIKKIAFSENKVLLEPFLLTRLADLLHPLADPPVLVKVLRFLRAASKHPLQQHLRAWHTAVFKLAPLMSAHQQNPRMMESRPSDVSSNASQHLVWNIVLEEVLAVLMNLSEHEPFRTAIYASGSISPLLALPTHDCRVVQISSTCVLSHLCESGLSRDLLCSESSLVSVLRVLQSSACLEVTIGMCYVLCRLVCTKPVVKDALRQYGSIPLLLKLLRQVTDDDGILGIMQLLKLLDAGLTPRTMVGRLPSEMSPVVQGIEFTTGSALGACAL